MSDPMCSLIARTVVQQSSSSLVASQTVAAVILSDGTYFIAAGLDPTGSPWIEYVRVWRLAADLSVLGTADLSLGTSGWPTPSAVAMAGNKVLLTSHDSTGTSYDTWYSWVIDCTGDIPVVEHENGYTPSNGMDWSKCGQRHVYDPTNDRVIWAGRKSGGSHELMLEVFRASTGVSLCQIVSSIAGAFLGFIGLHMNPTDATKFIATAEDVIGGAPGRLAFTVSLSGTTGSYDGITAIHGAGSAWDLAAGTPYVTNCGGILGENYQGDHNVMACVGPLTGTVVASVSEDAGFNIGINTQGASASLGNDRYLVSYNEQYTSGLSYRGSLTTVDQLADPPVMELLDLDYFDQPVGVHVDSTGGGSVKIAEIDANDETGVILVAAGVATGYPSTYSVLVWAIQGPVLISPNPNLSGLALTTDVYFT